MKIERFEDIEAWQLARELTRKVYRSPNKFKDVYEHARWTRVAVGRFISYLKTYEVRKATNREPWTWNL